MFAGNEPPTPAASARTLAAAVSVALYQGSRVSGLPPELTPVVSSRSSCSACTRPVTCCPRLASCDTRPNWPALSAADATRKPPKTRPMTSASTISATSRQETGQSRSVRGRELRREVARPSACCLVLSARSLAARYPMASHCDVLAGSVLCSKPAFKRSTASGTDPPDQWPPAARIEGEATLARWRRKYPAVDDLVAGSEKGPDLGRARPIRAAPVASRRAGAAGVAQGSRSRRQPARWERGAQGNRGCPGFTEMTGKNQ